jgi:sortase A
VLFAACVIMVGYVAFRQMHSANVMSQTASQAVQAADRLSQESKERHINDAIAYNATLAASGQPTIGESSDYATGASYSQNDDQYRSLLNMTDDGIMARILIPKISVDMPVYHGTSDSVLNKGAGHLYGTSLPVHANNTNIVFSAHSGQISAAMFLRLGELRHGDFLYAQSFGITNGYRVDRVEVVQPRDADLYRVKQGEERLTLMTCWPVGINTERLVVSGRWHEIPNTVPQLQDAPRDSRLLWYVVAVIVFLVVLGVLLVMWLRRRANRQANRNKPIGSES